MHSSNMVMIHNIILKISKTTPNKIMFINNKAIVSNGIALIVIMISKKTTLTIMIDIMETTRDMKESLDISQRKVKNNP